MQTETAMILRKQADATACGRGATLAPGAETGEKFGKKKPLSMERLNYELTLLRGANFARASAI